MYIRALNDGEGLFHFKYVVKHYLNTLTLYQLMMHICVMSVLLFFHKSIRIYMEVIILGANTLYSVFCFFKALLPKQVWSGMVGKGLLKWVLMFEDWHKNVKFCTCKQVLLACSLLNITIE